MPRLRDRGVLVRNRVVSRVYFAHKKKSGKDT